jgi:hypothetical protein
VLKKAMVLRPLLGTNATFENVRFSAGHEGEADISLQTWRKTISSAPLPISCAENRDYTERKKDRAKNISIPRPSEDCAEQRQGGEQNKLARLSVHSRS